MIELAPTMVTTNVRSAPRGGALTIWSVALFVAAVFFIAEHDLSKAGMQVVEANEEANVENLTEHAAGGNELRQVAFLSVAALGVLGILRGPGRVWKPRWFLVSLMALAGLWCLASVAWSVDPAQSLRRFIVSTCCLVGAIGLARQIRVLDLCRLVVVSGLLLMLTSFLLDVAAGARPWIEGYRFGGTLHPNTTACYCALIVLAACTLATQSKQRVVWWGVAATALVLLWLTNSRTALAALGVTWLTVWWLGRSPAFRPLTLAVSATLFGGFLMVLGTAGMGLANRLFDVALLGRTSDVASLTGRVPLWQELLNYVHDRPLAGYGYESFWTRSRIEDISVSQEWAIESAHSAYLELMLNIGWIGLLLVALVVFSAAWHAGRLCAHSRLAGCGFIFGALLFGLVHGALESLFVRPYYPTVTTLCGLCMIAFFELNEQAECTLRPSFSPITPR